MEFLKRPKPTTISNTLTPYDRAKGEWDNQIGTTLVRAKNWRLMAIIEGVGIILLLMIVFRLSGAPEAIPYIVEIDRLGKTQQVLPLNTSNYTPSQIAIRSTLIEWLKKVRSIPLDAVVLNNWQKEAYWFVSPSAKEKLTAHIRPTRARFSQETVTIEPVSIDAVSANTYQIIWDESDFKSGVLNKKVRWRVMITISINPPKDEGSIRINPLGIWIRDFNWRAQLKQGDKDV